MMIMIVITMVMIVGDNSSDALMVGVMTIIVVKVVTACGVAILVSDDCK